MTNFGPPQRLIDQLPTQYVTPKRQEMMDKFLEATQKADQPLYELLSEIKELAVRVRPDYCEQWLNESFVDLKEIYHCHKEGKEEPIPLLRTTIIDKFIFMLEEQYGHAIDELSEQLKNLPPAEVVMELTQKYGCEPWLKILEFYAHCEWLLDQRRAELIKVIPAIKKSLRLLFRGCQPLTQPPARKTQERKRVRPKRKKR